MSCYTQKELEEYKKISNSSRVLQEDYKNKTESQERENEETKKK